MNPFPEDAPGVHVEEDLLPGGAEDKATRETGSPMPFDKHPEVDYPFVYHGRSWFKGPYEILPDDSWIKRRNSSIGNPGRCPGYSVELWRNKAPTVRDAIWAEYLNTYGPPPEIPEAAELAERTILLPKARATPPSSPAGACLPEAAVDVESSAACGGSPSLPVQADMRRARGGPPRARRISA